MVGFPNNHGIFLLKNDPFGVFLGGFTIEGNTHIHPGRLTAGTYKSSMKRKENDLPDPYDSVPAVNLPGCIGKTKKQMVTL